MIRVISPEEYDAAARLHPALCPLVAAGDTRCGRRLLADAEADAAREPAAAFGCGEAGLRLIQAARAVAQRLRRLSTTCAAAVFSAAPGIGPDEAKAGSRRSDPAAGVASAGAKF